MILDKFFFKYEGRRGVKLTTPEKNTLKKPSLIRVNVIYEIKQINYLKRHNLFE